MALRVAMTLEQCWHEVPGGTARAALGLARALRDLEGIEVVGVSALHLRPPPDPWAPPVPVRPLPLPRLVLYEAWHRLRAPDAARAAGGADVVHATSLAVPPRRAPLVVTVHDLAFLEAPRMFTARGVAFMRRGLELARRDADLVLCPSRATAIDCEAAGIESERLSVVPHGVDPAPASPPEVERVLTAHGIPRPYVLWAGTLEPRKNVRALLAAWRLLGPGATLVLVGPRGWHESLPPERPGRRVLRLGFVDDRDLRALYAGARAFCYPSLKEGFGLPVLEAMAQGTPVVTSRGTATEEVAGDAGLLVDPRAPEEVADALQRLLADDDLHARLSSAARRRASLFTWEHSARLTLEAYRKVT